MGDGTSLVRPAPLVGEGVSMSGNDWFPLEFDRLRKSKWWRRASDTARARNIMLWGEAYKQVPAGSMPDDDDELAEAAGFGMDVDAFLAFKDEIMAPWVLCSDGRWYHPTVCEKVLEAWDRRRPGRPGRQVGYHVSKSVRKAVIQRDGPQCHYCGRQLDAASITMDHVIPRVRGGLGVEANLRVACRPCNSSKRTRAWPYEHVIARADA